MFSIYLETNWYANANNQFLFAIHFLLYSPIASLPVAVVWFQYVFGHFDSPFTEQQIARILYSSVSSFYRIIYRAKNFICFCHTFYRWNWFLVDCWTTIAANEKNVIAAIQHHSVFNLSICNHLVSSIAIASYSIAQSIRCFLR